MQYTIHSTFLTFGLTSLFALLVLIHDQAIKMAPNTVTNGKIGSSGGGSGSGSGSGSASSGLLGLRFG